MKNLLKKLHYIKQISVFLTAIFLFSGVGLAQNYPPAPLPKPKSTPKPTTKPTPKPTTKPKLPPLSPVEAPAKVSPTVTVVSGEENESLIPSEKTIAVEEKVIVSLCVSEGKVKINGWEREEVRAFVDNGSVVGFNVAQKHKQTGKPTWLKIVGANGEKGKKSNVEACLFGEEIEIDVPINATVQIKSRGSEITIESVAKARVENGIGNISLNNISGGIEAKTFEGDISVEKSSGEMNLMANGAGNIFVFEVTPNELGESFRVKTVSGSITLQSVEHLDLEAASISGVIRFIGNFLNGGQYALGTTNGSILLMISPDSSCKISASFGFGSFQSDFPLKEITKNPQTFSAVLGSGGATVNITTSSGSIRLRPLKNKNTETTRP